MGNNNKQLKLSRDQIETVGALYSKGQFQEAINNLDKARAILD